MALSRDDTLSGLQQQSLTISTGEYIFSIRDEKTQVVLRWEPSIGVKWFSTAEADLIASFRIQFKLLNKGQDGAWGIPSFARRAIATGSMRFPLIDHVVISKSCSAAIGRQVPNLLQKSAIEGIVSPRDLQSCAEFILTRIGTRASARPQVGRSAEAARRRAWDRARHAARLGRTCLTWITRLGFGRDAMDRVANHRTSSVTDVYDRHGYGDEDKRIMAAVARHVIGLVEGTTTSNVVSLGNGLPFLLVCPAANSAAGISRSDMCLRCSCLASATTGFVNRWSGVASLVRHHSKTLAVQAFFQFSAAAQRPPEKPKIRIWVHLGATAVGAISGRASMARGPACQVATSSGNHGAHHRNVAAAFLDHQHRQRQPASLHDLRQVLGVRPH